MSVIQVSACWTWQDIAEYMKCGRSKALNLINACPYSKPIDHQNKRRVLASDFVQWFRTTDILKAI